MKEILLWVILIFDIFIFMVILKALKILAEERRWIKKIKR